MLIHPELRKIHENSIDEDIYYLGKYEYLKKHNFFTVSPIIAFESLNESMVKEGIINTNQIIFEVTDFCNLNCTYCGYGDLYEGYDVRNLKNIDTVKAINFLKYIFDIKHTSKKNKIIIGFYGGEPLLNIEFIKRIVEFSNQLKTNKELDISYSMTTNATLIHKYIDFLVENKFELLISLDGNEENHSYRIFRKNKKNSFHKVIENIDRIQRDYTEYFSEYVSFNAVLHNKNSVKDIYEFVYLRYHKIPRISELVLKDINPDNKKSVEHLFHSKQKSEIEYQKEESNILPHNEIFLYKELTDFLKYYSINFFAFNINSLLGNEEKYFPTDTCIPFKRRIFFSTNNKLFPCEKINKKYFMGEINENIVIDIPKITQQYNHYYEHIKKVCQHCYHYRTCGSCIFFMRNLEKLGTTEFVCERFYDQNAFIKKMYRIMSFLEKYSKDYFQILENVTIV
jgi:uncharacterized protein